MSERDEKGLFQLGHTIKSPGRPKRSSEQEYLAKLTEICSLSRWSKVVEKAVKDAEKGNGYARAWLSDYILGKPVATINLKASEQVLLNQLLQTLEVRGLTASAIFEYMLQEMAESEAKNG
ncbi:MAG: hypothetical protein H0X30_32535 [Anaerolineae bacterium]|nr:hypothetical protein [Anaerolineae bacterium]